jgi:hypothetical protein
VRFICVTAGLDLAVTLGKTSRFLMDVRLKSGHDGRAIFLVISGLWG